MTKFRIYSKLVKRFVTDLSIQNLCDYEKDSLNDVFNNKHLIFQKFTGYIDKNDKEIYEGDIVEFFYSLSKERKIGEVIEYGGFYIKVDKYIDNLSFHPDCKVIGNIFEYKKNI